MISSFRLAIPVTFCLMFSLIGCASRPDKEIQLAQDAMNQATEQRAEEYAPAEWKSAKEAWDQAQSQLSQERFAAAAASFVTAKARLLKAAEVAKAERESMHKQVIHLREVIDSNYAALKSAAAQAKLAGAAKKEFDAVLADIDKRIALVASQTDQGDYIGAKKNAQGTLQAIDYAMKKFQIAPKPAR